MCPGRCAEVCGWGELQHLPVSMSDEVEENGVRINIKGTCHAPKKNEVMYNSEMLVNR